MSSVKLLFSPSVKNNFSRRQTLTLIGLAGLVSLLMAVIPLLGLVGYPFRLLLTIIHELGHGLAALLTGGSFIEFVIYPDGAGLATTAGGWRLLVIPAGYLGVAVFGAVLILMGRNHRWSRMVLGIVGAVMALLSLRYGLPGIFSGQILSGILTTISGLVFGVLFLWVAIKAAPGWIIFLTHLIAIQAVLTTFSDLLALIGLSARFFDAPANDAQSMAELTYVPAVVWAIVWAIVALCLVGGAIWLTWIAPKKRIEN